MWKIIVLCTIVGLTAARQKAIYDNYTVFRITPTMQKQVDTLCRLEHSSREYSFWRSPSKVGDCVDLMVPPHKLSEFHDMVAQNSMKQCETYIDNVQALIDVTTLGSQATSFDFNWYHTLYIIYKYLDDLCKQYPDKVQIIVGGRTYEGRQIKGVKVSFKANNPGVFIEGGIHAREWISPAVVMYILHQLLTCEDPDVREMAERHDWYIFPLFNPDGYVYTHTTDRLWRKTRKPYSCDCYAICYGYPCYGSDANRNWGYKWMSGGSSNIPCSDTYAGPAPFSEIETKSMSEYIRTICHKFYAYISFHSYAQALLFPYGYTTEHLGNYDELLAIGKKTIKALKKRYGTEYVTGNVAETLYIASGLSMDWVKANCCTPITYTYELRDQGKYGFLLPPNQIIPTGEETLDSCVAMFKEAKKYGYPAKVK